MADRRSGKVTRAPSARRVDWARWERGKRAQQDRQRHERDRRRLLGKTTWGPKGTTFEPHDDKEDPGA